VTTHPSGKQLWATVTIGFLSILGFFGCEEAMAESSGRLMYLPMIFYTEAGAIRTAACLEVTEQVYAATRSWKDFGRDAGASEKAFEAVISAIMRKDLAELGRLSDPTRGRDPAKLERQAMAFFQQFEVIKLVAVPRAYLFDGLTLFFAEVRGKDQTFFAPFAFTYQPDGSFKFLPYRTEQITYLLVTDWFNSKWGPAQSNNPSYCSDEEIRRANHRISLIPKAWRPSRLFLYGAPLDNPGHLADIAKLVKGTMAELKETVRDRRWDDLIGHLTAAGGERLQKWLGSASASDRTQYERSVLEEEPFFVFNASPLVIVYTNSPNKDVHVMYFTTRDGKLLWTNSSHVTVADQVFKSGALFRAAWLAKPFSNIAVK